jgi:hypothetical protein
MVGASGGCYGVPWRAPYRSLRRHALDIDPPLSSMEECPCQLSLQTACTRSSGVAPSEEWKNYVPGRPGTISVRRG